jgi:hypothetical protein
MAIASPFDGLQIPGELVCEFFAAFSRFEFTLKETGFLRVVNGRAMPAWRQFGTSVSNSLSVAAGSDLELAVRYLANEPPQVQIGRENWTNAPLHGKTQVAQALDAVNRVRNNLFHGGKHTPHSPPGRDERLIRAALTLLYECLAQDDSLRNVYEQNQF